MAPAVMASHGDVGGALRRHGDGGMASSSLSSDTALALLSAWMGWMIAALVVYAPLSMRRSGGAQRADLGKQLMGVVSENPEPLTLHGSLRRQPLAKATLMVACLTRMQR